MDQGETPEADPLNRCRQLRKEGRLDEAMALLRQAMPFLEPNEVA